MDASGNSFLKLCAPLKFKALPVLANTKLIPDKINAVVMINFFMMKIFKDYVFLVCLFDGMYNSKEMPKPCANFNLLIIN